MANKAAEAPAQTVQAPSEAEYSAGEFAQNATQLFGARKECVEAAMKSANVTSCTLSKAKEIVTAFLNKEVN